MKKLKAFRVACMAELSREQMALVQGGANEFLTGKCTSANKGAKCYISVPGGVETGTCGSYSVTYTYPGGNTMTYTTYTCLKD